MPIWKTTITKKEEAAISQNSLVVFGAQRAHSHTQMVGWLGEETTESLALFRQGQSDPEAKCCLWIVVLQKPVRDRLKKWMEPGKKIELDLI